ncbi:MAG: hypothetical protein AB2L20_00980 [Mangrovibacterium sp.]
MKTLETRAVSAYKKHLQKQGAVYQEPGDVTVKGKFVYISNANGILAKYNHKTGEISG